MSPYFKNINHYMNWLRKVYRGNEITLSAELLQAYMKLYEWSRNYTKGRAHEKFTFTLRDGVRDVNVKTIEVYMSTYSEEKEIKDSEYAPGFIKQVIDLTFPGVYFFLTEDERAIYVGKSVMLCGRVLSSLKERLLRTSVAPVKFQYLRTDTEADCHVLEMYFIAKLKPFANNESASLDNLTFDIKHKYKLSKPQYIWSWDEPF